MDLKHARTFVTVAELGTVSKAAQHLRIAQPALSRQIGALEQQLGIRLFHRIGRRLMLTGEGEQLLGDCRTLLSCASAVGEHAQRLQRGNSGVLRIGFSPQVIEGTIAAFLNRFAKRYPNVQVKLVEAIGWMDTVGLLERGDIHLGQNLRRAAPPDDQRFASYPLALIDLLAASSSTIGRRSDAMIDIVDLAQHPLLLLDTSYLFRRTFNAACRLADVIPNVVYESRTPHTLLAMAESGHGVAVIPSGLRTDRHPLHLAAITYRGKPLREQLAIYWDRRRPLPHYATAFCEMLAEHMRLVFPISRPTTTVKRGRREPAKPDRRTRRAVRSS